MQAPAKTTVVEEVSSFSAKPAKNTAVKSAPPQKKPETAQLKASAPDVKDTKEPKKDIASAKKAEDKKSAA